MFLTAFFTFDSSKGRMGGWVVRMGVCWLGGCVGILIKANPSDLAKKTMRILDTKETNIYTILELRLIFDKRSTNFKTKMR